MNDYALWEKEQKNRGNGPTAKRHAPTPTANQKISHRKITREMSVYVSLGKVQSTPPCAHTHENVRPETAAARAVPGILAHAHAQPGASAHRAGEASLASGRAVSLTRAHTHATGGQKTNAHVRSGHGFSRPHPADGHQAQHTASHTRTDQITRRTAQHNAYSPGRPQPQKPNRILPVTSPSPR